MTDSKDGKKKVKRGGTEGRWKSQKPSQPIKGQLQDGAKPPQGSSSVRDRSARLT